MCARLHGTVTVGAGTAWLLLASHEGAARVRAEPFDAVELDLTPLWGEGG